MAAIETTVQRNTAADLFFEVSTPTLTTTTQPLIKNLTHHPHTLPTLSLHTQHNKQTTTQPITHTLTQSFVTYTQVNAKIYVEEARKLGTNLRMEVFEPVLDEEGDIKNMVMYMVAETMADIPLELKWWTGRMDASNNAVREMGEMAIADWGDLHRNTTKQTQTKNRNATHTNTIHTNTLYLITKPPQTEALLNTTNIIATQPNTLFSIETYLMHTPLTHNNPAHTFLSPRQILTHGLFVTQVLATGPPEPKGNRSQRGYIAKDTWETKHARTQKSGRPGGPSPDRAPETKEREEDLHSRRAFKATSRW